MKFIEIKLRKDIDESAFDDLSLVSIEDEKGVKAMKSEFGIYSYQFDIKNWTQEKAEQWVKEKTEVRNPIIKSFTSSGFKNFNDDELSFDAVASTESIDREGDILRVNGWKLKNFVKNPVLLWGHDASGFPVGKALNVRKENGELTFTPKFEDITMKGQVIYQMFKEGYLNAFSVRFDPIEFKRREKPDDAKDSERFGYDYTKLELLEISVVTIPANAEALVSRDFQSMLIKSMQIKNAGLIGDETERKEMLAEEIKMCTGCNKHKKENENEGSEPRVEKSGRVLSAKNRTLVKTAVENIGAVMTSFQTLLEMTEEGPKSVDDEVDMLKNDLKKFEGLDDVDGFIQSAKERLDNIEGGKEND